MQRQLQIRIEGGPDRTGIPQYNTQEPLRFSAAALATVEKAGRLFRQRICGLMRAYLGRFSAKVHTFRPRCIFRHVHAPAENDLIFFAAAAAKLYEVF